MAGTLSQAKEMFKSIDVENTGLISREELKVLMQEIGGELWTGDNFDNMLEACAVAPGSAEVQYDGFLEQLLVDHEQPKGETPREDVPKEAMPSEDRSIPAAVPIAASAMPSAQDFAEAEAVVEAVCARVVASMNDANQEREEEAVPETPAGDWVKVDISGGDPPRVDAIKGESKHEEVKVESTLEEEAPAAAA